jgi:hypothetical protein
MVERQNVLPLLAMADGRRKVGRSPAQSDSSFTSPASLSSPRRSLTNSSSLPDEVETALLEILVGNQREAHLARPFQVYDRNTALFGEKNTPLRRKVHRRIKYLEQTRKDRYDKFVKKCREHGVQVDGSASDDETENNIQLLPAAIDFLPSELDSSRGSGRMTSRFGPGTIRLTLGDPVWAAFLTSVLSVSQRAV